MISPSQRALTYDDSVGQCWQPAHRKRARRLRWSGSRVPLYRQVLPSKLAGDVRLFQQRQSGRHIFTLMSTCHQVPSCSLADTLSWPRAVLRTVSIRTRFNFQIASSSLPHHDDPLARRLQQVSLYCDLLGPRLQRRVPAFLASSVLRRWVPIHQDHTGRHSSTSFSVLRVSAPIAPLLPPVQLRITTSPLLLFKQHVRLSTVSIVQQRSKRQQ